MTTKRENTRLRAESAEVDFMADFRRVMPNLYGAVFGRAHLHAHRMNVLERDDGTWLVVLSAIDPVDGAPMVLFGQGGDAMKALQSADKAMAANKWKPDQRRPVTLSVGVVTPQSGGGGVPQPYGEGGEPSQTGGDKQLKML